MKSAIAVHIHENDVIDWGIASKSTEFYTIKGQGVYTSSIISTPLHAFIEQIKLDDSWEICYTVRKEKRHSAKKQFEEHQNNQAIAMRATQPLFIQVFTAISRRKGKQQE